MQVSKRCVYLHQQTQKDMKILVTEIKVGDKIKVYQKYAEVTDMREYSDKSMLFNYVNIDGISNSIVYRKSTLIQVK